MSQHINIFIASVPADELLRNNLKEHLAPLNRKQDISIWDETAIAPGEDWAAKKKEYLNHAHIILLLISSDFLASDYMYNTAVKTALKRHQLGEVRVIPVILRECLWESEPELAVLRPLPQNKKSVTSDYWRNEDQALTKVATGIQGVAFQLLLVSNPNYAVPNTIDLPQSSNRSNSTSPKNKGAQITDDHTEAISDLYAIIGVVVALVIILFIYMYVTGGNSSTNKKQNDVMLSWEDLAGTWYNKNPSESFVAKIDFVEPNINMHSLKKNQWIEWLDGVYQLQVEKGLMTATYHRNSKDYLFNIKFSDPSTKEELKVIYEDPQQELVNSYFSIAPTSPLLSKKTFPQLLPDGTITHLEVATIEPPLPTQREEGITDKEWKKWSDKFEKQKKTDVQYTDTVYLTEQFKLEGRTFKPTKLGIRSPIGKNTYYLVMRDDHTALFGPFTKQTNAQALNKVLKTKGINQVHLIRLDSLRQTSLAFFTKDGKLLSQSTPLAGETCIQQAQVLPTLQSLFQPKRVPVVKHLLETLKVTKICYLGETKEEAAIWYVKK